MFTLNGERLNLCIWSINVDGFDQSLWIWLMNSDKFDQNWWIWSINVGGFDQLKQWIYTWSSRSDIYHSSNET